MALTACVDIRALPLQLLLRSHPEWAGRPVVVVDRDKPQGVILWVSESARKSRIYPGMRYAAGLSLSPQLCGGTVGDAEITDAVRMLTERLWQFSPSIEPSQEEAGVFWLDASGLQCIYPSLEAWAETIKGSLREMKFSAVIAIAFSRFGSYAMARSSRTNHVFRNIAEERSQVRRVPLHRLHLDPKLLDTLLKLGIQTLGGFIDLPPAGIIRRFGAEAAKLHRLARGESWDKLLPADLREPIAASMGLDYPETDTDRLLAVLSVLLQPLLGELACRHEDLATLHITLKLDNGQTHHEEIAPAAPTLIAKLILTLCRLRLETLSLDSGVIEVGLSAAGIAQSEKQDFLFPEMSDRKFEAVEQALAKIRAEFGPGSTVFAQLHEGHMPEASYSWEPFTRCAPPVPTPLLIGPLVRQIYTPPRLLPPREHREPDGWLVAGLADGPVEEVIGPHFVNGGWWLGEVAREYYDVRTRSGRWLWIYYDRKRRRWYLQGEAL